MSEPSKSKLPPLLSHWLTRAQTALKSLSVGGRMLLFSTLGLALVGGAVFIPRALAESYTTLFAQLDPADSGAVVAKLKELKIPYRLEGNGDRIEVPEERVHDVRLELAGAGLPRGGGVGFESFDKLRLGATDFEQRVMYRRALEGELARTIGSLSSVQSARVHLVLPEKSVFVSKAEPASASIVVKLRPGRALGPGEIGGIVHLTASSAPGLRPEHITLLSADGTVLHRPRKQNGGAGAGSGGADDGESEAIGQARNLETSLEERARAMVERIVGAGRADVRVSAELDLARFERTEDRFDPARAVMRSEERTVERGGLGTDSVAGVPGAEANLPTSAAPKAAGAATPATPAGASALPAPEGPAPAQAAGGATIRESHTRNFEIGRITEKRISAGGSLKRLTVAVVVDGVPADPANPKSAMVPRTKQDLDKIAVLVRSAVGLHDARGDVISVESVPFAPAAETLASMDDVAASKGPLPSWATVSALLKTRNGKIGAGVLGGLLFIAWVMLARHMRRARAVAAAEAALPALPKPEREESRAPQFPPAIESIVDPRSAAQERALRDPATAALVVRAWLGTSEIEERASA